MRGGSDNREAGMDINTRRRRRATPFAKRQQTVWIQNWDDDPWQLSALKSQASQAFAVPKGGPQFARHYLDKSVSR
ncbi:hypothetical protein Poly21_30760 [Allorhodopirellula heiligendammensis]|uniref:Uncharacterized protein n=1 Tax=Allorhodopirellula heiligendammensis TaxID=2714739 RepID=A0A5C6BYD0_9BACT|nr:hypothetical protein Poly21_30760 [Allorhodopirellula heiligendammensis]